MEEEEKFHILHYLTRLDTESLRFLVGIAIFLVWNRDKDAELWIRKLWKMVSNS